MGKYINTFTGLKIFRTIQTNIYWQSFNPAFPNSCGKPVLITGRPGKGSGYLNYKKMVSSFPKKF